MAQPARLLCVFVAMVALARPVTPQSDPAKPEPVLDNVDLMDLMVKPAYDELKRAMAKPPDDRKVWAALYQKAARLAELENLLFFRTRAGESRQSEWVARAAQARAASAAVAAAALLGLRSARAADFQAVRNAFPAVANGCTTCHRAFAREAPVIKP